MHRRDDLQTKQFMEEIRGNWIPDKKEKVLKKVV